MEIIALMFCLYILPAAIAGAKHKRSTAPIAVVNIFLGWTFIGWVAALAWAVAPEGKA